MKNNKTKETEYFYYDSASFCFGVDSLSLLLINTVCIIEERSYWLPLANMGFDTLGFYSWCYDRGL